MGNSSILNNTSLVFPQPIGLALSLEPQILHLTCWWLSPEVLPCPPLVLLPFQSSSTILCCLVRGGISRFLSSVSGQLERLLQESALSTSTSLQAANPGAACPAATVVHPHALPLCDLLYSCRNMQLDSQEPSGHPSHPVNTAALPSLCGRQKVALPIKIPVEVLPH